MELGIGWLSVDDSGSEPVQGACAENCQAMLHYGGISASWSGSRVANGCNVKKTLFWVYGWSTGWGQRRLLERSKLG